MSSVTVKTSSSVEANDQDIDLICTLLYQYQRLLGDAYSRLGALRYGKKEGPDRTQELVKLLKHIQSIRFEWIGSQPTDTFRLTYED